MKKIICMLLLIVAIATWGNEAYAANTECAGTATESTQGDAFTNGYNYTFTTSGTDVTFTVECLDSKVGLIAYAWTYNPDFAEAAMTNTSGQIYSKTFSGQTIGATFKVACKFAYSGGMAVTKELTYTVGNSCGATTDSEAPTVFTATKGTVGDNSVELLLNATDNSGAVVYSISYGSTPTVVTTSGTSGTEKSYTVTGLSEGTDYSFSVTAKDAAGNVAANSPIKVDAKTTGTPIVNTECAGKETASTQGDAFVSGYKYAFTTSGTDVTFAIECLDTKTGLVAYAWFYNPDMVESQMTNVSGQVYSKTFTGLTLGATIGVACKFAYAGGQGMAVTKKLTYTVGNACGTSTDTEAPTAFTATKGKVDASSVELLLNATDNSGAIAYSISYGSTPTVLTTSGVSGTEKSYTITGLSASTAYKFSVTAKDVSGNAASNNPITVDATTTDIAVPTVAPKAPTTSSSKVISIFSDVYKNVAGTNMNPFWGQTTTCSKLALDKDTVIAYSNLNYQGIEFGQHVFTAPGVGMDKLHLDIWTPNETSIQLFPICFSSSTNTAEAEKALTLNLTQNSWNYLDIPLTQFTDLGLTMKDVYQFKIVGSGGKIIYVDNIYFYDSSSSDDTEAPASLTATVGTITSDAIKLTMNSSDNKGIINFKIKFNSDSILRMAPSATDYSYTLSGLTPAKAYSIKVYAYDLAGNVFPTPIALDATTLTAMTTTASDPKVASANVISVYSNAYTSISGVDFSPAWGQSTVKTEETINGNNFMKYANFNYIGITFSSPVDVSGMTKVHMDIYPTTQDYIEFGIISTTATTESKENNFSIKTHTSTGSLVANTWNSIDIPLSLYVNVTKNIVDQLKFAVNGNGTSGGTFYVDNLYFYNDANSGIEDYKTNSNVKFFPNPVVNNITISTQSEFSEIRIVNLLGQTLISEKSNGLLNTLDVSSLQQGNYLLVIKLANGQTITKKITK